MVFFLRLQSSPSESSGQFAKMIEVVNICIAIGSGILLPLKWFLYASILYFCTILLVDREEIRFRTLFVAVAYCQVIFSVMSLLGLLVFAAHGGDGSESFLEFRRTVGLEFFIHNTKDNPVLAAFLREVNVFQAWYIVVLSRGLNILIPLGLRNTVLATLFVWLCVTVFNVGSVYAFSQFRV
jgi:hypothetical protein